MAVYLVTEEEDRVILEKQLKRSHRKDVLRSMFVRMFKIRVKSIKKLSARQMAIEIWCGVPRSRKSAGAKFLMRVRDMYVSQRNSLGVKDINEHDIAILAPSVSDIKLLWQEFVDLEAYQEGNSDTGILSDVNDLEGTVAAVGLHVLAETLVRWLKDFDNGDVKVGDAKKSLVTVWLRS